MAKKGKKNSKLFLTLLTSCWKLKMSYLENSNIIEVKSQLDTNNDASLKIFEPLPFIDYQLFDEKFGKFFKFEFKSIFFI